MRYLLTLVFCLGFLMGSAKNPIKNPIIYEVRELYQKAAMDENACRQLIELLKPYHGLNNPLLLGYKGGANMMMAQHVLNPFTKLSYFKKGKDMLHRAIEQDAKNVELRFLRFAAQTKAPAFLGYRHKITEDKTFLLESVSLERDPYLKKLSHAFLVHSDFLNEREKQVLKHKLK